MHVHITGGASLEAALPLDLPTRVITYAWGERYVEDLLGLTIPALLAPGNLPYLAAQVSCEAVLLTEERFFAQVGAHPAIARLRRICPLRLIGLDDLIGAPDKKYGMALTFALHRGFADLGPAMTDSWQIFLNADFILADGSLRNLLAHLRRGERIVAAPSYCVVAHEVTPELVERIDPETFTLSLSSRDMARLVMAHRHNTIRGKTVNQDAFHIRYMDQFYWLANDDTLIGHQMPVAIVGMRPQRYLKEPNAYWDHGLIREFCPTAEPAVIGDSDEFLMVELREKDVAQEQFVPGRPNARELGKLMISWVTPYQREFAQYPLTLRAADLPADINEGRKRLRAFIEEVLSYVPAQLPSHLNHPQWIYHWPGFMAARFQFLSRRFGSLTEAMEPPEHLSAIDQAWWRLDGAQKLLTRRQADLIELKERTLALIRAAIKDAASETEKLINCSLIEFFNGGDSLDERQRQHRAVFACVTLDRKGDAASFEQTGPSQPPSEQEAWDLQRLDMQRFERQYLELCEKTRPETERLNRALEAVSSYYAERLSALDRDMERVNAEYLALTGPLSPSNFLLISRTRLGPAAPLESGGSSAAGRMARRLHRRLFGQWPHVTLLSPSWGALHRLHDLIADAAARGAKDVLILGDRSGFADTLVNLPGLHAWASVSSIAANSQIWPPYQFDLCVCDLHFHEFLNLQEVCNAARRFLRPGGTIIGFCQNFDGAPWPFDHRNSADRLHSIPAKVYYGGSKTSVALLGQYRTARVRLRRNPVLLVKTAIRIGLTTAQVAIVNAYEAATSRRRTPPAEPMSITAEIRIPEFEHDDGTVQYAKAAGLNIEDVEDFVVVYRHPIGSQTGN